MEVRAVNRCCSVSEFVGTSEPNYTPKKAIQLIANCFHKKAMTRKPGHVLFTIPVREGSHAQAKYTRKETATKFEELRKYVEENGFGSLCVTPPSQNNNYSEGRLVQLAVFHPNAKRMKEIAKAPKDVYEKYFGAVTFTDVDEILNG